MSSCLEEVIAAVTQGGPALRLASPGHKANREVVLAAVMQNGRALRYASPELKANPEVVLAAVKQYGNALGYASPGLKNGGLAAIIQQRVLARATFQHLLLAARFAKNAPSARASPSSPQNRCWVPMLNSHGIHHAVNFKRLIADFAGAPRGEAWAAVCGAKAKLGL